MNADPFNFIFQAVIQLLTTKIGFFDAMGLHILQGLAVIFIAWFGIKSALSSSQGGKGFDLSRFADFLILLAFAFTMLEFYTHPIPVIGMSFSHIVTNETDYLSHKIGMNQTEHIISAVNKSEEQMGNPPGVFSFHEELTYFVVFILLATVQAVVIMIVAFGVIATAVCMLVGPLFIPFFIVPGLDWLFWGWFRSFLQYAFYQVIANAFIYIFAKLILGFFVIEGPVNLNNAALLMPALFMFLLTAIYGLIKIPSLTNSIFTGRSGEHVIPL